MTDWTAIRVSVLGTPDESLLPRRIKAPTLLPAGREFIRLAADPQATLPQLAAALNRDPKLSDEVLRYINSSVFNLDEETTSVEQAIGRLGIHPSRLFVLAIGMKSALSVCESKLINLPNFWITNLERALFAREIATLLAADRELAFAGAMLQDCLLPIVSGELWDLYLQFFSLNSATPPDLAEFERENLGWDHAWAIAHIMLDWKFPDDLVCCVCFHHRGLEILDDPALGQTAAAAVAISALLPDAWRQVRVGIVQLLRLEEEWPEFKLLDIVSRVDEQFHELCPNTMNEFSLLRRVKSGLRRQQWSATPNRKPAPPAQNPRIRRRGQAPRG